LLGQGRAHASLEQKSETSDPKRPVNPIEREDTEVSLRRQELQSVNFSWREIAALAIHSRVIPCQGID
jgi:hypothetical protein